MTDEILIQRLQNGWILKQYDHDDEAAYGPLTTVHEDSRGYQLQAVNEAESLAELLQEAFPHHMRSAHQPGIEITVYADRCDQEETTIIPPRRRWPTFRFSSSGINCDICGEKKESVEVIPSGERDSTAVCRDCRTEENK